ncbi:MAG: hypothetical protein ACI9OI_001396 [Chitinophagales bacterium]
MAFYGCINHPVSIQGFVIELSATCLGSAS